MNSPGNLTTRRFLPALGFATSSSVIRAILQFLAILVLARILTVSEFGIASLGSTLALFASLFSEFGVTSAVSRWPTINQHFLNSAFWINCALSWGIGLALFAGAPSLDALFHDHGQLTPVIRIISLAFVLNFYAVHQAILERRLAFGKIAIVEITSLFLGQLTALSLALRGFGAPSLAVGTTITAGCSCIGFICASHWRPSLRCSITDAKALSGYSGNLLLFNLINYWSRNGDNLALGKFSSLIQLGLYGRAYSLMMLPVQQLSVALNRVLLPTFSHNTASREEVWNRWLRSISIVWSIGFPASLILSVLARPLVALTLGQAWQGAAVLLAIMALSVGPQVVSAMTGTYYQAIGRTDAQLRVGLVNTVVMLAGIAIGVSNGARGVAMAVTVCFCANFGANLAWAQRVSSRSLSPFLRLLARSTLPGVICYSFSAIALWGLSTHGAPLLVQTLSVAGVGLVSFALPLALLDPHSRRIGLRTLRAGPTRLVAMIRRLSGWGM